MINELSQVLFTLDLILPSKAFVRFGDSFGSGAFLSVTNPFTALASTGASGSVKPNLYVVNRATSGFEMCFCCFYRLSAPSTFGARSQRSQPKHGSNPYSVLRTCSNKEV